MNDAAGFPYAGARMQHRYGRRPADATWQQLARIEDFGHLIQTVRTTALEPWITDFGGSVDVHRIESGLRERYRQEVDEVAGWLPHGWSGAAAWLRWLPDLAAIAHVRRGRPVKGWMLDDPLMRDLAGTAPPGENRPAGLSELLEVPAEEMGTAELWIEAWQRRWPAAGAAQRPALAAVARAVRRLAGLSAANLDAGGEPESVLRRIFRRHTREPAGALAYLALLHMQFRRLRGLLLRRRIGLPMASRD